jgi:hypothetical protein
VSVRLALKLAFLGFAFGFLAVYSDAMMHRVFGQEGHNHYGMRGDHPPPGGPDPYLNARNQTGFSCCHGADCTPYHGPAPIRLADGTWKVGRWIFRDDQRTKPETLAGEQQWEPSICIGAEGTDYEQPYCFYWPQNG